MLMTSSEKKHLKAFLGLAVLLDLLYSQNKYHVASFIYRGTCSEKVASQPEDRETRSF